MNIGEETVQLGENAPMTNDWFDDNLSFSSDFDVDAIKIEEGGTYFQRDDKSHSNCISKQEYEKEKKNWEDSMTEITQRYNRTTSMLDSMKSIVLEDQKRIEVLEKEKKEALEYKDTFEKLQEQIVNLNNMLYEANEETEVYKKKTVELKETIQDLEDKLYGPTNYYYKLYLEAQDQIEQLTQEKNTINVQLRQVKDILRDMIIDKSKAPTEEDLNRERQSFAREVAIYEKKINKLQEENDRLRNQLAS